MQYNCIFRPVEFQPMVIWQFILCIFNNLSESEDSLFWNGLLLEDMLKTPTKIRHQPLVEHHPGSGYHPKTLTYRPIFWRGAKLSSAFKRKSTRWSLLQPACRTWFFLPKTKTRIFGGAAQKNLTRGSMNTTPETNSKRTWKWMVGRLVSFWDVFLVGAPNGTGIVADPWMA